jgi:hypothetical protein
MADMQTISTIMSEGKITAAAVKALEEKGFPDGITSQGEAEIVYRLDRESTNKDPSWNQAYIDWLTDYYIWRTEPAGSVSEEQANHLIPNLLADGRISGETELELLLNIVGWAHACAAGVGHLVLKVVWESVTGQPNAAYGLGRPPNVVDAADVEILRKAIYAPSANGGIMVSRPEAELLFALNNATSSSDNDPGWEPLFVNAVASHLMYPSATPSVTTTEQCARMKAAWERQTQAGDLIETIDNALLRGGEAAGIFGARTLESQEDSALLQAAVDEPEAKWLLGQIKADGVLDRNERALLAYIREKSPCVDSSLDPLFALAGLI